MLTWEDLLKLRRNEGLAGHAEMEGKTLFVKFNTGPSGHGSPPAAGEAHGAQTRRRWRACASSRSKAKAGTRPAPPTRPRTRPTASASTISSTSSTGTTSASTTTRARASSTAPRATGSRPTAGTCPTAKNGRTGPTSRARSSRRARRRTPTAVPASAGSRPARGAVTASTTTSRTARRTKRTAELFWETKRVFAEKYGVEFDGIGSAGARRQGRPPQAGAANNFERVMSVLREDRPGSASTSADRLVEIGESVPRTIPTFRSTPAGTRSTIPRSTTTRTIRRSCTPSPAPRKPNRAALASWGAWVNAYCQTQLRPAALPRDVGRSRRLDQHLRIRQEARRLPGLRLVLSGTRTRRASSCRSRSPSSPTRGSRSASPPSTCIREPEQDFLGFMPPAPPTARSRISSYGPMRLFAQLPQDCPIQVGKVLWMVGHSGPETAEDARTHFGIFEPGVTQLLPDGHVVDLHPWEHERSAGGARRGAQARGADHGAPPHPPGDRNPGPRRARHGVTFRRGARRLRVARLRDGASPGCGIDHRARHHVDRQHGEGAAGARQGRAQRQARRRHQSPQLFRAESADYREWCSSTADRVDSTVISNRGRRTMYDWFFNPLAAEYAMTPDFDDRWRTGGSVDEIIRRGAPLTGLDAQGHRALCPRPGAALGADPDRAPGRGRITGQLRRRCGTAPDGSATYRAHPPSSFGDVV